jgi:translation initiation factor IF-2
MEGKTVKVFEFAKEIGMETLALMDKIREWKLPVRSHMADLDSELIEQIRIKLRDESGSDAAPKKATKKVAKSAVAADEVAESTLKKAAAKSVAKPIPKPVKATKAKPAAEADEAASGKKVVVKKAAAKVVVRKKVEEEEAEALAAAEAQTAAAAAAEAQAAETVEVEVSAEAAPATALEADEASPSLGATGGQTAVAASAAAPTVAAAEAESATSTENPATPAAEVAASTGPAAPARKREVMMTPGGPQSGIRSQPRGNIVGRMDLSRVQAPAGTRPMGGPRPAGPGGPSGFGGPRPGFGGGPRPLRAGFVAPPPPLAGQPNFDHDELDRKKAEAKKEKARVGAGTGKEEEVQTFSATEFRKREMVFQPKKKKGTLNRPAMQTQITQAKASKRVVKINGAMKVADLAQEIGVKAAQLTKKLMGMGMMATMTTELDFDTIALVVPEFGWEAQNVQKTVDALIEETAFGNLEAAPQLRPPVVTIMGHVDHGKTSLLDAIRNARVAQGEAGGITQHIGAYQVTTSNGQLVSFIDTPGHEAFTAMRARGANVTDIVIIVVAADDGVMPQTVEAINHAKAAEVPIIVAVNKMDKPGANPDRIKQQMTEFELVPEEWGGTTIFVPVSALKKTGLDELLEQISLVAEIEDLKANPDRSASGVVIESRMDKGRGPVATLLVQEGTLKVGQSVVVGSVAGRVRSLINDRGDRVQEAPPSMPVEILGLEAVPNAGDKFDVVESDEAAARIAETRRLDAESLKKGEKVSMDEIFAKLKAGAVKEMPIVLKSDVAGSAEAIKGMFEKLATDEVKIKLVHSAVGGINESDVLLASTAKGFVVGFNVRPDGGAQAEAKRLGVEIKTYGIVYELMDDMKKALGGLLSPETKETQLGRAEVRNLFTVPKIGTIAGSFVLDGKITRQAQVRLVRDGKIIYTGKLASLKRFKDDAREVAQGFECGIGIENYNDLKVGDVIEAFSQETVQREL